MSLLGPCAHSFETPFTVDWSGSGNSSIRKSIFAAHVIKQAMVNRPLVIHAAHLNLAPLARSVADLVGATTILNVYGREVWSQMSRARRRAIHKVDCVIADCNFTSNYVTEQSMRRLRPFVVWDCVDMRRFSPGISSIHVRELYHIPAEAGLFIIMTLGRISKSAKHKGFERLLKVFAKMEPSCPNARLVIAGSGDLTEDLKRLALELHIEQKTFLTGSIAEAHLPDVYRSASIFSLISDRGEGRGEGIPLTPLEALACGVPILVGDQDGSQEAVLDGRNGIICNPSDLAVQTKILLDLYKEPALLQAMREQARSVALRMFGYDRFLNQCREIYQQLGYW
jgi:phosphatidylinositol alpha-1,6-mannosyltransferase